MRTLFADTFYWTALLNPRDQWHQPVRTFNRTLTTVQLITSDEVLTEFLNFFSSYESQMRHLAWLRVEDILKSRSVQVIPSSHEQFLSGLTLYSQRPDKGYSLTDCISMQIMTQLQITEVLTNDKHFAQEGFVTLFR